MKSTISCLMFVGMALSPVFGQYTFFSDDFESADPAGPNVEPIPLLGNGMVVGANIFTNTNEFLPIGYFGFDAPNITGNGARFCNVAAEQGGPNQGTQVLAVFSDYNNTAAHMAGGETEAGSGDYTGGQLVDANVYLEYFIEEADLGTTVTFKFDAKLGDFQTGPVLGSSSGPNPPESETPFIAEAQVFLKVLDPANDFATLGEDAMDATMFPITWSDDNTLTLLIDPAWMDKVLQAGFRTKTSNFAPSAIFYDNVSLTSTRLEDPGPKIVSLSKDGDSFIVEVETKADYFYTLYKGASPSGPFGTLVVTEEGDGFDLELFDDFATETRAFYRVDEQQESPE